MALSEAEPQKKQVVPKVIQLLRKWIKKQISLSIKLNKGELKTFKTKLSNWQVREEVMPPKKQKNNIETWLEKLNQVRQVLWTVFTKFLQKRNFPKFNNKTL